MKEIPLTQGKVALVDDADYERVMRHVWCAVKKVGGYYGQRNLFRADGVRTTEYLHSFILGFKSVDHRNGDGLDCRRENLRSANKQQNGQGFRHKPTGSSSRFRGVNRRSCRSLWTASIRVRKVLKWLGTFTYEDDAARAYDAAALKYFGEFAAPNFPVKCRD